MEVLLHKAKMVKISRSGKKKCLKWLMETSLIQERKAEENLGLRNILCNPHVMNGASDRVQKKEKVMQHFQGILCSKTGQLCSKFCNFFSLAN